MSEVWNHLCQTEQCWLIEQAVSTHMTLLKRYEVESIVGVFGHLEARFMFVKKWAGYDESECECEHLLRRDGCHSDIRKFWVLNKNWAVVNPIRQTQTRRVWQSLQKGPWIENPQNENVIPYPTTEWQNTEESSRVTLTKRKICRTTCRRWGGATWRETTVEGLSIWTRYETGGS